MTAKSIAAHPVWARTTFILAATGSAVGLGNIWKFPYVAGQNGGGAFVLVYLFCVFLICLPVFMAEAMIGRNAEKNPVDAMAIASIQSGRSVWWKLVAVMGVMTGFLILTYYSVVAGWSLDYMFASLMGAFNGISSAEAGQYFDNLVGSFRTEVIWHSLFMLITTVIIAGGVNAGLEKALRIMMPVLFGLLLLMLMYSIFATDEFAKGAAFLLSPDFSKLTLGSLTSALGLAFFTLSLGMGAIMAYGAYMPRQNNIIRMSASVAILDTSVALVAGLAIFPIVFANGMEPSAGPGLIFVNLPTAFGEMPGGQWVGFLFFVLIAIAALSSAISLIEPATSWISEHFGLKRKYVAACFGLSVWSVGLLAAASFNVMDDVKLFGMNFFDLFGYMTDNIMLPLVGLLIAIFAGWLLSQSVIDREIGVSGERAERVWRFLVRYVAPVAIILVMMVQLGLVSFGG
jgi:NSS family neurotransmitter:Na+ symporter